MMWKITGELLLADYFRKNTKDVTREQKEHVNYSTYIFTVRYIFTGSTTSQKNVATM